MYRLPIVITLLLFLSACGGDSDNDDPVAATTCNTRNIIGPVEANRITFGGAGDLGIFDPSIARDPGSGRLWMSYSSVSESSYYARSTYWRVGICLAYSDNDGDSWQNAGIVVSPSTEQLVGPVTSPAIAADSPSIWQSETSSLVYDPGADPDERWKIIWFQYLHANDTSYFADFSWIAMKTASTPAGLAAATPVKLFGGFALNAEGGNSGAPIYSPIAGAPAMQLNTDLTKVVAGSGANLADLDKCVFAEPGMYSSSSAVYMAIFCADATTNPITEYLVYFRCNSPCDMTQVASWEYVGRLLTPADAVAATGEDHFQAPSLVEKAGSVYLIVTPVNTTTGNVYYGCEVYKFVDIDSIALERSAGVLVSYGSIGGEAGVHSGACDAYDGLQGGIVISKFNTLNTPETFRIYKSQVYLP